MNSNAKSPRSNLLMIGFAIAALVVVSAPARSQVRTIDIASAPLTVSNNSDLRSAPVSGETVKPLAARQLRSGAISDWSQHHVLFPTPKNSALSTRLQNDPRYLQSWYLRHRSAGGPGVLRGRVKSPTIGRDWSEPLGTVAYQPIFDYSFTAPLSGGNEAGFGSLNSLDVFNTSFTGSVGSASGLYLATGGTLTITESGLSTSDVGTYPLYPVGPGPSAVTCGGLQYDNLLFTGSSPIDDNGLIFGTTGSINIWNQGFPNTPFYFYWTCTSQTASTSNGSFTLNTDPGAGQTFPAKYSFYTDTTPTCANQPSTGDAGDYVAIGVPANAVVGTQANIIGYNNLYTNSGGTGLCSTLTAPTVLFSYASGTGQVPGSISLSLDGTKLAYVENQFPSATNLYTPTSFFHVLTWVAGEGTSATVPVLPDAGNDLTAQLTPDLGTTNQSSTTSPFIDYIDDVAYVTTYSWTTNTGYLYKISPVFGSSATNLPAIVWSQEITGAVPSSPIFDAVSGNVFFTDSLGNIDSVTDEGSTPSAITSLSVSPVTSGVTSTNPVTVDPVNEVVYATFNTNGTNSILAQAPVTLASATTVPIGDSNTTYTGPYDVDFNNAWYSNGPDTTGSSTPMLFVTGQGAGTTAELFGVPFTAGGDITATGVTSTALSSGLADASPVTEFYNTNNSTDYLFVGVTNNCVATTDGGTAGCVMSLNITPTDTTGTTGFPAVSGTTVAIAALGGPTGIIVDNDDDTDTQTANIYYATKNGVTPTATVDSGASNLVQVTQSGLQ
jgi:hypothetical protein